MRRLRILDDGYMPEHIDYRKEDYKHDQDLREAYECGRKDGWREAMYEAQLDERRGSTSRVNYRRDEDYDDMDYRRHRDRYGRFTR